MLIGGGSAVASAKGVSGRRVRFAVVTHGGIPRLGSRLSQLFETNRTHGTSAAAALARAQSLAVAGGRVRVIVQPRDGGVGPARAAIGAVGGSVEAEANGLVQALVPVGRLQQLAGSSAVSVVRPPATPVAQSLDEGVSATGAAAWQTAGFDGTGVKIAIIDLGFYGYQSLLGTALPSAVVTDDRCGGNLAASPADGGTEHGTAVAELVHQMAPGAQLYLMCVDTEVDLALAEQDAVADGVKVINHSVAWFGTSRGDGTGGLGSPDATVADARAHGILWVNAAGNYQEDHWSGTFAADASQPAFNDFVSGDDSDQVTMQPGEQACAFLQWDDWPVTSEDFDLELYTTDGTLLAGSTNEPTDAPFSPTEALCYTNTAPTAETYDLAISDYNAVGNPRLDLYYDGSSPLEYATAAGSVSQPASSPDALAVGAQCWQTGTVEPYSSEGPTIAGVLKPDLVAPDSVSTVTYGYASGGAPGCGNSGFAGTSASAPQVAGAAADLLTKDPSLTAAGLEAALESTSQAASGGSTNDLSGNGPLQLGQPSTSANGGMFVFVGPDGSLYRMYADGTGLTAIAVSGLPSGDSVAYSDVSPDGQTIAFTDQDGALWTVPTIGGTATELVPAPVSGVAYGSPSWSPGAMKIAYGTAAGIGIVDADGTNPTLIPTGDPAYSPAWSPLGTELAYANDDGPAGGGLTVVSAGASAVPAQTGGAGLGNEWSADGTKLIWATASPGVPFTPGNVWIETLGGTYSAYEYGSVPSWPFFYDSGQLLGWLIVPPAPAAANTLFAGYLTDDGTPTSIVTATAAASPSWTPVETFPVPQNVSALGIGGEAVAGETLSAQPASWRPASDDRYTFAWSRCNSSGSNCAPISGASDSAYTIQPGDVGSTLVVTETATDTRGAASVSSSPSAVVAIAAPYATSLPTISGSTTSTASVLTVDSTGAWVGSPAFTKQWLRCAADGSSCTSIAGQTGSTYTTTTADLGSTIRVEITGSNAGGSNVVTSLQTGAIGATTSGGGGGGGGGSSSVAVSVSPSSQTVAAGGTATWSVSVTNTGSAYLSAVTTSDAAAPGCGTPGGADGSTLDFMAPRVTVTYSCSLAGVTASFTNTVDAVATTGPGPKINASATASVIVEAPSAPPAPVPGASRGGSATFVLSSLRPVVLDVSKPRLTFTVKLSKGTTLVLTLVNSKDRKLAEWVKHEKAGTHRLSLLLPLAARHHGHDTLRITDTGNRKPRLFPVKLVG